MKENKKEIEVKELAKEKGGKKMKKERELNENKKGGDNMNKGGDNMDKGVNNMDKGVNNMDKLKKEIEEKRLLLVKRVIEWAEGLRPVRDVHVRIKGRYYPLIEKETGKLCLIDKVQGKKVPLDTLEQGMKFVIASILAERKEEIEKEVEEDKKKYLEKKLQEIDELLLKF